MTRRRWIADEVSGDHAALVGRHADHLVRVLRAQIGEEFDIALGSSVRLGQISSISADRVEFDLGEEVLSSTSAGIILILAVFKFDRMEWAIEKCTELGVSRILPFVAHRTDSRLAAASVKRVERWRRIAQQAAEQSRRAIVPQIETPVKFPEVLRLQASLRIVLAESEHEMLLRNVLSSTKSDCASQGDTIALAIGPEGGWTDDELRSFREAEWRSASLGNTILRAETAAMAATAIVSALSLQARLT